MNVLGIETSCDETSASVVSANFKILSNVVLSQDELHAPFGGVVPELASRQHITSIVYVVEECLRRAGRRLDEMEAFAVTQGPGLVGSLLVGLSFAKALAYYFRKPLVAVDHLEAHIESAFLENRDIPFPGLALVVSGGHTSSFFLRKAIDFRLVGRTRDDAAGEALDKVAKFLGLGYPGGPVIDRLAAEGNPAKFRFAIPRMTDSSLDFSFSGLKTAALKLIRERKISRRSPDLNDFLASFEMAVIRALVTNLSQAVRAFKPRSLILCGGVARNRKLRNHFTEFGQERKIPAFIPSPEYCTDNGAMVAALGLKKLEAGKVASFSLDLNAYPRYSSEPPATERN